MKRYIYKLLFLLIILIILPLNPVNPIEAAEKTDEISFSLIETEKTLYLGLEEIEPEEGDQRTRILKVRPLVNGFDKKKYDITLKSGNKSIAVVSSKKDKIYAKGAGKTKITVKVKDINDRKTLFKAKLTVFVKDLSVNDQNDKEDNSDTENNPENKKEKPEIELISSDTIVLKGEPVNEDYEPEDIQLFEIQNGIRFFYAYSSQIEIIGDEARIKFFKSFESSRTYSVQYDGNFYDFVSEPCSIEDVIDFEIVEDSAYAGEGRELTFVFYNQNGLDITSAVEKTLLSRISLTINDPDNEFEASLSEHQIFIYESGKNISVEAVLDFGYNSDGSEGRVLKTTKTIKSLPKRGDAYTGNVIYTVKQQDDHYLSWGDRCSHTVPIGDKAVIEALFEMDDGNLKSFQQIGINNFIVSDVNVLMIGENTKSGGYELILNNEGTTSIIALINDTVVYTFEVTVLPARKPVELRVELSKDYLNTNELSDDYILIKADLYDQYDSPVEGFEFSIEQSEANIRKTGAVRFEKISEGRFVVNGYECPADKSEKTVVGKVKTENFTKDFRFFIKDVEYDSGYGKYVYKLEADGSLVIDTATGIRDEAPKSTFVTAKISRDGYYVGEGIGYLFDAPPEKKNNADFYGVPEDGIVFGITVEYTSEDGEKRYLGEDEACVVPAYMDLEFIPYKRGIKLESGIYKVALYRIVAGAERSSISLCDSLTIRVIDSDPEIEVIQIAQTYTGEKKDWKKAITEFFEFRLDGEDISEYITKVDCAEALSGSVFIKSVNFRITDPYYGKFTKTALVERLITKQ